MSYCERNDCISGGDLPEAEPDQLGAALGAIARRPVAAPLAAIADDEALQITEISTAGCNSQPHLAL